MADRRSLPSVDRVLRNLEGQIDAPRALLADEIRAVLASKRAANGDADGDIEEQVRHRVEQFARPSLRRVINATGVVLHTNLGRAPLAKFRPIEGWSNLELDLVSGKRGKRDAHTGPLLERLLGRPAVLVNNNAAAVYLVLHELAPGGEAIVSRGELIEIGDGFRIPEIMARSGAFLREVGTTNRTRIEDYASAVNERTRVIMRVHPSNFQVRGFTGTPKLDDLCRLGRERGIPVYEDLGSGCLVDLRSAGVQEPLVSDSLRAGVNLVSFSCDKLLGGPQSGIVAGDADLVSRVRRNPMYRTFRLDKLVIEALERTLRLLLFERWSEIPALRAIFTSLQELRERASRIGVELSGSQVRDSESPIGGGSTPDQVLPTCVVEMPVPNPDEFVKKLRQAPVPVIARIAKGTVVFDMRTVSDDEVPLLTAAARMASGIEAPDNFTGDNRR